jgi:hypothetical protein
MNEYQQYYGQQQLGGLAPQGFLGGLLGAPLGGLIGRGIGGLFGNANLGSQIGQAAGGIGGSFLPLGVDPVTAAYAQQAQQQQQLQQAQLAPQGWFGNIIKSVAQPLGGAIGGAFGNAGLGNTIGGIAGQLGGMLPFSADPVAQAYAQQAQLQQALAPQGFFSNLLHQQRPYGGVISPPIFSPTPTIGSPGIGNSGIVPPLLPFGADPVTQAYAQQQAQLQGLAPQGWFGNIIKSVAQPLGGAIGGAFGNAGLGNTIGGIAGQLGGMLPFGVDPVTAAYAQQQAQLAQLAQQTQLANAGNTAQYGGPQTLH